jgi:hypothetical protein
MNPITLPRITICASALGTVALLCMAPFALPRVSPSESQPTAISLPIQSYAVRKLPKPSPAHHRLAHITAPARAAAYTQVAADSEPNPGT